MDQTFYRWRKEYGGLKVEQAKKLKDLPFEEPAQLQIPLRDQQILHQQRRSGEVYTAAARNQFLTDGA